MLNFQINFNKENFNSIFPFYILINNALDIVSTGDSLKKIITSPLQNTPFFENFEAIEPSILSSDYPGLESILNTKCKFRFIQDPSLQFQGQILKTDADFVFVGTPLICDFQELEERNLKLEDFAAQYPLVEFLKVRKSQKKISSELKSLAETVHEKNEQLRKDHGQLQILSSITETNINPVIICDKYGNVEWVNPSFTKLTGYTLEEIMGKKPGEFLQGEETCPETKKYLAEKIKNGEPFNCEIINYGKYGNKYWLRIQGQALKDENGAIFKFFAIQEDITLEKQFLESVQKEKEKYQNILNNMNMGLMEVDNEGIIQYANQAFCDISEFEMDELIGKKAEELFLNSSGKEQMQQKSENRKRGYSDSYEISVKTNSGKNKYWLISGGPNYNISNEVIGSIGVHLDITEKKLLEIQKEELLKNLESQNEQLNDYAKIVSHDLKSPLRSIHSLISWIKEDSSKELTETTNNYLEMIEGKVEKMDQLIEGILNYSKLDSHVNNKKVVDMYVLLNEISSILYNPKKIKINIDRSLPKIYADQYKIHQLFQNLISNAINHHDKNDGYVDVIFQEAGDDLRFTVEDNGPGIAPSHHDKIFQIFESLTNNHESTGVGLSIVKKVVEQLDGTIKLESDLGKGSRFIVEIPRKHYFIT